jgi:hypothetical protein
MPQESIYRPAVDASIPGTRNSNSTSKNSGNAHDNSVPEWLKDMQEQQSRLHEKLEADDFNPDYFADLLHQAALFDLQENNDEHENGTSSGGAAQTEPKNVSIFHSGYYFGSDSDEPSDNESEPKKADPRSVDTSSNLYGQDFDKHLDSYASVDAINSKKSNIKSSPIRGSSDETHKTAHGGRKIEVEVVSHSNNSCGDNDDFIELQWDHFLPPVKCVPAVDLRHGDLDPAKTTSTKKDNFDVKSPLTKSSSRPVSPIQTDFEPVCKSEPTPNRLLKQFLQQDKLSKSFLFDGTQFKNDNLLNVNISLPKRGLGDSMEMLRNEESVVAEDASDLFHPINKPNKGMESTNNPDAYQPELRQFTETNRKHILETRNSSMGSVILDNYDSDDDAIDFNTAHAPFEIPASVAKKFSPHKATNRTSSDSGVLYSSAGSGQMFLRTVQLSPTIPATYRLQREKEALDTVVVQDV